MADRNELGQFEPGNKICLRYKTAEVLQTAIDTYFSECKTGKLIPTYSGLAYHLGITREALYRIRFHGDDYTEVVHLAISRIMADYEQRLITGKGGNITGLIFALKQWGWSDKQEVTMDSRNLNLTGFTLVNPHEDGR